ncbi:lantibiotic dehydratase [Pontibacter virosus]|uniref:Thiopeptide-type bacteriocin biosynthesis protein n=1 Tax=Pontibacter virosus TaxID=1765052 RepID=A0A2U1AWU6_9BACT|nr:lantibiotic dehydratase [Pontibacter virosus]PVY40904.1 thiopeptide-type bacteriocin biosynthesis protein [Pontibacter virosus]
MFKLYPRLLLRTPAYSYATYATADLGQLLQDPYFRAALQLASRSLFHALEAAGFHYDALSPKVKSSLAKYLNRMCFRPTPFGLFSGFSLASWGAATPQPLQLEVRSLKVHLSLAFADTLPLAEKLLAEELAPFQRYRPNRSLYKGQGGFRYLRVEVDARQRRRKFSVDGLTSDALLQAVLRFCQTGPSRQVIIDFVSCQAGVETEESAAYVEQLLAQQVLVSNLGVNITGQDYLLRLLRLCEKHGVDTPRTRRLQQLLQELGAAGEPDACGQQTLVSLKANKEQHQETFYANLEKGLAADNMCNSYQNKILEALRCLQRLVPQAAPAGLQEFVSAFAKKFEERAVPLLVALDPELGVGYAELAVSHQVPKLLEDISFIGPETGKQMLEWSAAHALLLERWQAAGPYPAAIRLTEQDLESLPAVEGEGVLPPSAAVLFRVLGQQVYIEQAGGVSATALLGRFTPLSPAVQDMTREIAHMEEQANPEVVFAEIAHVGDAHTANIDRRAAIRSYEIPVLVQSTLPEERQIQLSELWVQVERGEVVLWSERLQKVVVPRLGSAFNFVRDDLAIFRFLCDLQYQGVQSNFSLDLSRFFPKLSYYPRVEYQSAILQLASWQLGKEQLERIFQAKAEQQQAQLLALARALHWPPYLALTQHDHQLVFHLEAEKDRLLLLENLKGKSEAVLREFPFASEEAPTVVDNAGQPYVQQFLAAVYQEQPVYRHSVLSSSSRRRPLLKKRKLVPGDGWLYFKIYCHPARANSILTQTLQPLLRTLEKEGSIRQWFYVRYRDPAYHVRLRLCLAGGTDRVAHVLDQMRRKLGRLLAQGSVQDYQLAVYERELERYDPALMDSVEQVFCASSALVTAYLRKAPFAEENYAYYGMAFQGMETMLEAFGLDIHGRVDLLGEMYSSFFKEFGATKALQVQLASKYREISQLPGVLPGAGGTDLLPKLSRFQKRFKECLTNVAQQAGFLQPERQKQFVSDLIHMHLNRLLVDQPRQQELVLYYCLWKHYQSVAARIKQGKQFTG